MKGKKLKRGLALVLGLMLAAEVPASVATPFQMFDSYAYTGAATVKATSLNVRSGAGTGYSSVGRLAAGAAVTVIGEQRGTDGNTWYQIQYTGTGGAVNTGYVSSVYIRLPVAYTKDSNFEAYLTSQGFPESYKNGLRQLHAQYPNWVFKAKNTGLDWNTVIENESITVLKTVEWGLLSVFCLGDRAEGVFEQGVQYPLEDAVLTAEFPLGVSNHILEPEAEVRVDRGALAVGWELFPLCSR